MNRQGRSDFVAARPGRFLKAITSHRGYHHRPSIECCMRRSCLRRPAQRSLNIWRRKLPASMGTTEHKYADFRAESASPNSRPTVRLKESAKSEPAPLRPRPPRQRRRESTTMTRKTRRAFQGTPPSTNAEETLRPFISQAIPSVHLDRVLLFVLAFIRDT